jgi:hypothetical protein
VDDGSRETLQSVLESQDEAFEKFRKIWHETYLLSLREHSRNLYQSDWNDRIKVNDIVLIKHPNKPRPYWLLGRVIAVILGHDSIIRSVKLKQGDGTIAHHTISNLYPLELSITHNPCFRDEEDVQDDEASEPNVPVVPNVIPNVRPTRIAALKCKKFIRDNLDDL